MVVEFDSVTKTYAPPGAAPRTALRDASFSLEAGRRVAVTGRSGSGKSTLLHLAAGIDAPSEGRVSLLGRDLGSLGERERTLVRRETVGLVFQFFHLIPHLSVRDNVALPEWIAGTGAGAAGRADSLLERVGLVDRACDPVQRLSGGEMQRVAICRALVRKPKLLLADEPTGNLDDDNARMVMDLLLRLAAEEGSALLYVTHSDEMAALADARWTIHSGVLETS